MISQRSIDEVYAAIDIVQYVESFDVKLKKQGANYVGLSPFTNEKTPSFSVSPSKGIFKCFSSGEGGNAITFAMKLQGMTYPEAIEHAADFFNVRIEKDEFDDDQHQEKVAKIDRMRKFIGAANKNWKAELASSEEMRKYLDERGVTQEDVLEWQLGFSPNEWTFLTNKAIESGMMQEGVVLGIIKESKSKKFDVYRNRIIIPIEDNYGNVISFGGRTMDADSKVKYINGTETDLYQKSKVLFGYHRAVKAIGKSGKAYLAEGYFDVISFHRAGIHNTVASCGTGITIDQIKLIKRNTNCIALITDGDKAGIKAAMKTIPLILSQNMTCEIVAFDEGVDPDDFIRNGGTKQQLDQITFNAILWHFKQVSEDGNDPLKVADAIDAFCKQLLLVDSETLRDWYMGEVAKNFSFIKKASIKKDYDRVCKAKASEDKKKKSAASRSIDGSENVVDEGAIPVPNDVKSFYDEFGFYIQNKQFYFFKSDDNAVSVSNFCMTPLFHIHSKQDDRRLIQLERFDGRTAVIDIPSTSLVSMTDFKKELVQIPGNFMFRAKFTNHHFMQVAMFIGETMPVVYNLSTLGQQSEGFFAFADGIVKSDKFEPINEFGIVQHTDEFDDVEGNSHKEEKRYYLPAFSSMNKNVRADEDPYENERSLQFRESDISLGEFFQLFDDTFREEKSKIGIAFLISSCFRDLFISKHNFFPLLFCFGEKGSGKSAFALTLQNFFFYKQQPYMLNSGTDVGFYRRMQRVKNVVNYFDEYTDQIDEKRFQSLKAAWNGMGREKGVLSRDNRTEISKVNSALVIAGQYISARDDNSLTSRSILLEFIATDDRPDSQRNAYDKLKVCLEEGVSSLLVDIIKHRPKVKKELNKSFRKIQGALRTALKGHRTMDRIIDNFAAILAPVDVLKDELPLPFSYKSLFNTCIELMKQSNEVMVDSEGVGSYWQIVQNLVENNILQHGSDFEIKQQNQPLTLDNGDIHRNEAGTRLLFFRYQRIHGEYLKEFKHQFNERGIDQTSLKGYIKARPYFIGTIKSYRLSDYRSSVFVLNYDELEKTGVFLKNGPPPAPKKQPELEPVQDVKPDQGDLPF